MFDPTLSEYLYSSELKPALDLRVSVKEELLADDEKLAKVAGLYTTYEEALRALVRLRVQTLVEELVLKAEPAETIILRRAIAEVSAILNDAQGLAQEYRKRSEERETQGSVVSSM